MCFHGEIRKLSIIFVEEKWPMIYLIHLWVGQTVIDPSTVLSALARHDL